jgi:REP element-mobilizing transposase RayT
MTQRRRQNSLRHQGWHYGADGYYFVTICTQKRECLFDSAEFKQIAEMMWQKIPSFKSATTVRLDQWVVMPNHIHGILIIVDGYSSTDPRPTKTISGSVGALVGTYKSSVTKRINNVRNTPGAKVWQRGYYDQIIRDEKHLNAVRNYIIRNPERWAADRDNLDALLAKMINHPQGPGKRLQT